MYRICLQPDNTFFEAAHSVHGTNYAPPWNARFGGMGLPVPYVNDMARGHSILTEAQQSAPFAPVNAMASIALS